MRKIVGATAIAVSFGGLTAVGAVVAAPQAEAAPEDCDPGRVCLFDDSNYRGRWVSYSELPSLPNVVNIGDFMNDRTTSIWNRTGAPICFFSQVNFRGDPFGFIEPGGSRGVVTPQENDRISSLRACSSIDKTVGPL